MKNRIGTIVIAIAVFAIPLTFYLSIKLPNRGKEIETLMQQYNEHETLFSQASALLIKKEGYVYIYDTFEEKEQFHDVLMHNDVIFRCRGNLSDDEMNTIAVIFQILHTKCHISGINKHKEGYVTFPATSHWGYGLLYMYDPDDKYDDKLYMRIKELNNGWYIAMT